MKKFLASNNTIWKVSSHDAHIYWLQSTNTGKLVSVSRDKVVEIDHFKGKLKLDGKIIIPLDESIHVSKS